MTTNEFTKAEIEWAHSILARPSYTMPNGKPSHQVAYEVLNRALDHRIETGLISAYGQWA